MFQNWNELAHADAARLKWSKSKVRICSTFCAFDNTFRKASWVGKYVLYKCKVVKVVNNKKGPPSLVGFLLAGFSRCDKKCQSINFGQQMACFCSQSSFCERCNQLYRQIYACVKKHMFMCFLGKLAAWLDCLLGDMTSPVKYRQYRIRWLPGLHLSSHPPETHSNHFARQCTGSNYIQATFHLTPHSSALE